MLDSDSFQGDAWLAGFAAGEGTFVMNPKQDRGTCNPVFRVLLRVDDAAILETLQAHFGGRIHYASERYHGGEYLSQPNVVWYVSAKAALARLVDYFDRFPLRNKKQRDYLIWRRAVMVYCEQGARKGADELLALKRALEAGRAYEAEVADLPRPEVLQLKLVEGAGA